MVYGWQPCVLFSVLCPCNFDHIICNVHAQDFLGIFFLGGWGGEGIVPFARAFSGSCGLSLSRKGPASGILGSHCQSHLQRTWAFLISLQIRELFQEWKTFLHAAVCCCTDKGVWYCFSVWVLCCLFHFISRLIYTNKTLEKDPLNVIPLLGKSKRALF